MPLDRPSLPWIRLARSTLAAFFAWWRAQLLGIWEGWTQRRLLADGRCARVTFAQGRVLLQRLHLLEPEVLESAELPLPADVPQALLALLRGRARTISRLEVVLPPEAILARRVQLPLAAAGRLKQAVSLQFERWMPLRKDQVYFDAVLLERDADGRQLRVGLAAARKTLVDAVADAALAAGVPRVRIVGALPAGTAQPCFLDRRAVAPGAADLPLRRQLGYAMGLLAAGLLVAAYAHYRAGNARLQDEVQTLAVKAEQAGRLRDALEQRWRRIGLLAQRVQSPDAARVLAELTRLLPKDAWVFQLQAEGGQIEVSGFAPNATAVSAALSGSTLFEDVALRSAVKTPGNDAERFDIVIHARRQGT